VVMITLLILQWAQAFVTRPLRFLPSVSTRPPAATRPPRPCGVHRHSSLQSTDVRLVDCCTPSGTTDARAAADMLFAEAVDLYERLAGAAQPPQADAVVDALQLLDQVFRLDFEALKASHYSPGGGRSLVNVTCMRPRSDEDRRNPLLQNEALAALDLECGRACLGGCCSEGCSRVWLPHLASAAECNAMVDGSSAYLPGFDDASAAADKRNLPIQIVAAVGNVKLQVTS
jgi:hypothetical protein